MTIIRLCASALFLIVLSDGYLDYPDLGCMDMDGICVPYSPGSKYYNNKFDIICEFRDVCKSNPNYSI
ncbi:hypothetical protein L596_030586 [Steinernema carpocapsae]|uniref:Kazal-like domain-containing protein n=1 Tax=Steinernema carpocapsae TaxID=34508 RepID=A0A4U5LPW2_STECR|nr:hypothetical protein L596_030586 [Steinernema carpocapsae]